MASSGLNFEDLSFGYESHPQTHTCVSHPPLSMHNQSFDPLSIPLDGADLTNHFSSCSAASVIAPPSALLGKGFLLVLFIDCLLVTIIYQLKSH